MEFWPGVFQVVAWAHWLNSLGGTTHLSLHDAQSNDIIWISDAGTSYSHSMSPLYTLSRKTSGLNAIKMVCQCRPFSTTGLMAGMFHSHSNTLLSCLKDLLPLIAHLLTSMHPVLLLQYHPCSITIPLILVLLLFITPGQVNNSNWWRRERQKG